MTWAILNLNGNVPCDMDSFVKLAMSSEKAEEQDFMRDVGIKFKGEDFEEDLLIR